VREELLLFTCVIHALQISTKYGVEPPSLETYTQPRPDEALVNIAPALRHTMHGRGAGGVGELIHPDLPAVGHDGVAAFHAGVIAPWPSSPILYFSTATVHTSTTEAMYDSSEARHSYLSSRDAMTYQEVLSKNPSLHSAGSAERMASPPASLSQQRSWSQRLSPEAKLVVAAVGVLPPQLRWVLPRALHSTVHHIALVVS
jgi:hypothetical protein